MPALVPLAAIDPLLVESLLDAVFGAERRARTAYRIRAGMQPLPALSFAALDAQDYLAAIIQCWPVALTDGNGRAHPLVMVGPVAVMPSRQGEGFGKALITTALAAADLAAGTGAALPQVLIGDAAYYGAWGFSAAATGGWSCPGPWEPERLLARCATPAILPHAGMLGPWPGAGAGAEANAQQG
ncbi:GNAT family N-acetyltransferase [Erythrobacteraceae bacterium CFH 75059]|uniref:GNAT family N-acetyltransferase n=1 Tax=Qipengyuania thermophila TaxID=2509361 RepID=UPI00101F94A7|nr:GNAT family N-acetyltransferase [Qipengyuania thermophila]TCD02307.1 GNAT family N-acetyltransferase [Erythrobacteraceae bacterium CFH 75059]